MPRLSVITTVYNGEKYISSMVESMKKQHFADFEWIIIDDGSTDKTWGKLVFFSEADKRIQLHRLPRNKGVGYANQLALSLAKGEYIAKVDVDDFSHANRFERQVSFLDSRKDIDVVDSFINCIADHDTKLTERYARMSRYYRDFVNKPWSSEEISERLYWWCVPVNGAMMARTKKVKQVGYNENARFAEDYELFYNMNKRGFKFYKLTEELVDIKISTNSLTGIGGERVHQANLSVKRRELERFLNSENKPLAIWGASNGGIGALRYIESEFNKRPVMFFDTDPKKIGSAIDNIKISAPKNIENYKILIQSSYGREEIIIRLKQLDFKSLEDYYVIMR